MSCIVTLKRAALVVDTSLAERVAKIKVSTLEQLKLTIVCEASSDLTLKGTVLSRFSNKPLDKEAGQIGT